ncbi:MAG: hypothetical protein ACYCO3_03650 [Mycobacteriales bacterium]
MLLWLLGRGLGVAGYLSLTALVITGLWYRHPWRVRRPIGHPSRDLRLHASLALVTFAFVTGHVLSLASDRYAKVGFSGALLPGASAYRGWAVALGTIALYLGLLIGASAALGHSNWLPIHRIATVTFGLVWIHGVFAGADTVALRGMYLATGAAVLLLTATRRLARPAHLPDGDRLRRLPTQPSP